MSRLRDRGVGCGHAGKPPTAPSNVISYVLGVARIVIRPAAGKLKCYIDHRSVSPQEPLSAAEARRR
jgi:hypothetical protein